LDALNIKTTTDYAIQTPNLSFSYGSAGLGYGGDRSLAIRGISGPGTTGVYIDDTPVPGTFDPRLVDLERVEVLRGPQGTLFGQGSLGGNVRMITTQPSADARDVYFEAYAGATKDGPDPNGGLAFAGNQPLAGNLVARVTAFADHASGFITRTWPAPPGAVSSQNDQGATSDYGGSLALLWTPTENLGITARVMFQNTDDYGWPAAFAPLPGFSIASLTTNRDANLQEITTDRWYLTSLTFNYRASSFTLTSSTSYFGRGIKQLDDATEGSLWALNAVYGGGAYTSFLTPGEGLAFYGDDYQRITSNETRIAFNPWHGLSGIVGVFYSHSDNGLARDQENNVPGVAAAGLTNFPGYCPTAAPCPTFNTDTLWWSVNPSSTTDSAIFGELYYDWRILELTLGLRGYQEKLTASFTDSGAEEAAYVSEDLGSTTEGSVVPKIAISAKFSPTSMVYASAAKGFRAGGINQILPPFCEDLSALGITTGKASTFKSDDVWDYEVGGKSQFADNRMVVTGALFYMSWRKIQQSFNVAVCNLAVTLNEGAAIARGGEIELAGRPLDNLEIRAGFGYDDARFSEQGLPSLPPVGARVGIIPLSTWSLSGTYTQPLGTTFTGFLTPEVSHVGDSISYNTSAAAPFTRAPYTIVNARLGIRWDNADKYHSELALNIENLTNQHPNLGELGDLGWPARAGITPDAPLLPRVITLAPLTANLQYRMRF
jgi:outer membrane receptor protein involved in Fe transport